MFEAADGKIKVLIMADGPDFFFHTIKKMQLRVCERVGLGVYSPQSYI